MSTTTRRPLRHAQIVAESLAVLCPYCGEPLPNPDNGGDGWLPSELTSAASKQTCNSCDEVFRLIPQSKVTITPAPRATP